ncbi:MAG: hypothetical protein H0Z33_14795 [Bacillaceae bacterium]|nr:hypothetical protein [Bacillaceae bacterium]
MKLGKKAFTILSFAIGTSIFVSTAFADMALGSGYDRLKSAIKNTTAQMEQDLNNYTVESLITLKANDQTLYQRTEVGKYDHDKQAIERATTSQNLNGKMTSHYYYSDNKRSISKNGTDNKYFVSEFPERMDDREIFTDPFNEDGAPEMEKIIDALVGNLKDEVQVEEKPDGSRIYSGSLSEMQVPALINAVSSFYTKQVINDEFRRVSNSNLPVIESDIFVKKISGTAVENKAGLLENLAGEVVMSGTDKSGVQHDITLSAVFKLSDIGNTRVSMPDLSGADVETVTVNHRSGFTSKYIGTYKNNIVMEKNGEFVKIGERTLEITRVENDKVTGRYYETIKPEYASEYPEPYNFTFEYEPDDSKPFSFFTYTNPQGEQEHGHLHPGRLGNVYLDLNLEMVDSHSYSSNIDQDYIFNGELDRVFEDE